MPGRRSGRLPALSSPLTLLDAVAPAHRALNDAKGKLTINGEHYRAMERATEALDRLAADLGHAGRFAVPPPRANLG